MKKLSLRLKIFLNLLFTGQFIFIFSLAWLISTLPNLNDAMHMRRNCCIKILDKNGDLIAQYGDLFEKPIASEDVSPNLVWAIVDTEDKNFYTHKGLDFAAILRSLIKNIIARRVVSGASTITQQLAKNILQNEEKISYYDRSIIRKLKEAIFTFKLEKKYKKNEILALYINRVYFGSASFGITSAAKEHFNKHPSDLTLFECAALMGILKAPSKYAGNHELWKKRAKNVLDHMLKNQHITQKQYETAINEKIPQKTKKDNLYYFTDYIIKNLPQNCIGQDIIVTTTVDINIQKQASQSINETFEFAGNEWNAQQGAMIVIDKSGAVLALVGGLDYNKSQFNRAIDAKRSSGSYFKYFTYMEAINQGLNIDSKIDDGAIELGSWAPSNYLYTSTGSISIKDAFARSVNSVAVYLLMLCGIKNVIKLARKLGIKDHIPAVPAIALGGFNTSLIELSSTLLPVINEGYQVETYFITNIKNTYTGEIIYKHNHTPKQVISQKTVYYMWKLLRQTVIKGSCRYLNIPNNIVAAKSGTSNNYRDLLLIGATPDYIFACWFGRDDFQPMQRIPGKNLPLLACRKLIEQMPDGNKNIKIDMNFKPNKKSFEDFLAK